MRVAANKELFLLSLAVILLLNGCATVSNKYLVSLETLKEIFINPRDRTVILGKLDNRKTVKVLRMGELPLEAVQNKGTSMEYTIQLFRGNFRDAKLSPDKKYIAFSVQAMGSEWSGIYNLKNKTTELWTYFFDSSAGYLFWSPDGNYIAEEAESLAYGYCVTVKDFKTNQKVLAISTEFLQTKGVKGLDSREIIKDGEEYGLVYEIKFGKWADDSRRVFFKIVPECYYTLITGTPLAEEKKKEKIREDILKNEKDLGMWSVDIITQVLQREK